MNNDLICDKENGQLHWICNENKITFFIDDLALAMMDEKRNLVFALSEPSAFLPKVTQGTDIHFFTSVHPECDRSDALNYYQRKKAMLLSFDKVSVLEELML